MCKHKVKRDEKDVFEQKEKKRIMFLSFKEKLYSFPLLRVVVGVCSITGSIIGILAALQVI